jgi:hypothetical protein
VRGTKFLINETAPDLITEYLRAVPAAGEQFGEVVGHDPSHVGGPIIADAAGRGRVNRGRDRTEPADHPVARQSSWNSSRGCLGGRVNTPPS